MFGRCGHTLQLVGSRLADEHAREKDGKLTHDRTWQQKNIPAKSVFKDMMRFFRRRRGRNATMKTALEGHFDPQYYLCVNGDVRDTGQDPFEHFFTQGWREGRNPARWFSTTAYLKAHPDVARARINPFLHYLVQGKPEGREVRPVGSEIEPLYDWARFPERRLAPTSRVYNSDALDVHWVVPDFAPGGGGHMTIFRIAHWLEFFGHKCTFWINQPGLHPNAIHGHDDAVRHYQSLKAEFHPVGPELMSDVEGDVLIATGWQTVWPVSHAEKFKERFYFVQDYEPNFFPAGAQALAAEATYRRDLACICAGPWLENLTRTRFDRWAAWFYLAADDHHYFAPAEKTPNDELRIAFYCREGTSRRAVELGYLAFEILEQRGLRFHVDFFGRNKNKPQGGYSSQAHGVLHPDELGALYRQCDLGVSFSTTNYSLIPKEMMQCGLPVIEFDVDSTRSIFPDHVITLAQPEPVAIADAIQALALDAGKRTEQARNGRSWVTQFSWEKSARLVETALRDRLENRGYQSSPVADKEVSAGDIKASVLIPTYNGGELFRKVIERVRAQRTPWPFEICVVDSSSTDGTAEFCENAEDILSQKIPKEEFQHGRTRNLGVQLARGEFVALLTQDAMPADEFWLYEIVSALERHPSAAGAFGRHLAWPDATAYMHRDLKRMFRNFDRYPVALSNKFSGVHHGLDSRQTRELLHFFSDNNSCLRKSVWRKLPYPEVDYGEDQLWAEKIIEAGYQKIYAKYARVYHSHSYTQQQCYERSLIEGRYFHQWFGYDLSPKDMEAELTAINNADQAWGEDNGLDQDTIEDQKRLNQARLTGYQHAVRGKGALAG